MCWTENYIILKSTSIKIKAQKHNCCSTAGKPFDDHRVKLHASVLEICKHSSLTSQTPAQQSAFNKSYLFSEALRKMLKSNHVQQSTEAYVKLSRGRQYMPEKCLDEYG